VRYVGASNYHGWELMKALGLSDRLGLERYVSIQPSYSLADRVPERELVPLCLDQGVGLIAYFPLAGGLLTGKYRPGAEPPPDSRAAKAPAFGRRMLESEARVALAEGVREIAREIGATPSQVSLAWLVAQPAVASAIAGATRVAQVEENAAAAELSLAPEALDRLDGLSAPFVDQLFDESRLP
jgi:aryl-alcohol dehydrogenase-like predicted oxidoreductase